jgi:hypothetical protein
MICIFNLSVKFFLQPPLFVASFTTDKIKKCEGRLLEIWHLVEGFHFRYWYNRSERQLGKDLTSVKRNTWSEKFIDNSLIKIPLRIFGITEVESKHGGTFVIPVKFCFRKIFFGLHFSLSYSPIFLTQIPKTLLFTVEQIQWSNSSLQFLRLPQIFLFFTVEQILRRNIFLHYKQLIKFFFFFTSIDINS